MDYIGKWYKARILDCRLAKGKNIIKWTILAHYSFFISLINLDYDIRKEKSEASYEYYIHYEPLNRRND
jgi:hypothetical protein